MNANHKIAFALIAGAAVDAATVQALHARAKPPAYIIGEVDAANHDALVKDYVPLAMKALRVTGTGYRALAVGSPTAVIEGAPPQRVVVNAFNSLDEAIAAYNSAAYQEAAKVGRRYETFRVYAVKGASR